MALQYSPKIVQDSLVMCLDASNNKSYPTDLPLKDQLNLWLDAADDTTFSYSSGTTVNQWRDKSGQNNHAIVMAGSPLRSVAINSRKAVSFTSTTAFKCVTGSFSSTATHIVVCRATTSSATYQRVYHGGANTDFYVFIGALQNSIATFWGSGPNTWFDTNANSPSTTILNTLRIISAVNNGSTATPYYDGTAMSTKTTTNSAAYTGYELNTYSGGAAFQPLIGEVCEIIVFNKQLSLTELKQVHTYLGQKWGISNTDRSIVDLSNNNNNGLFGNATVANMPDYDFYNKGAFKFNGTSDFVKVGPNSSLQVNNVTIAAFFKTVNNGQGVQFIAGYGDTGIAGYWLGTSGGPIRFSIGGGSGNYLQQSSGVTPNNDQIYYVVGTYDGVNQRVYVDGVLQASATTVTGNISYTGLTDGFLLGQVQGFSAARYLTGNIYNVSVYSRALSQAEISQNYEALKSKFANTIVQQGLVLNLDAGNPYSYAGAGTVWYDVSGNSNNGTLTNSPTYSNNSIVFSNTANQSISISDTATLQPTSVTLSAWVYMTQYNPLNDFDGQFPTILWKCNDGNSGGAASYGLSLSAGQFPRFTVTPTQLISTTTFPIATWVNLVGVYTVGGSQILYRNGVVDISTTGPATISYSSQVVSVGTRVFNGTYQYPWNGSVSNVLIHNRALSAAEVLQNYNATKGRFGL
jgi:hypothetical protein